MNNIKYITTNLQDAPESSAVFYRINSQKNVESFNERIKLSKASIVYLFAADVKDLSVDSRIIRLNENDFENKKQDLINKLYSNWKKPRLIGITGTNGKSSVVHFVQTLLNENGYTAISIGTVGIMQKEKIIVEDIGSTTPSEIDLKRILHEQSDKDFICLEVSSHALDQNRVNGLRFSVAGFTNLTQDHLDYHLTMESYLQAKLKILRHTDLIYIPPDEDELVEMLKTNMSKYQIAPKMDTSNMRECFRMEYNIKNISLAVALVKSVTNLKNLNLSNLQPPKGRFTTFAHKQSIYVVDYAHTPDAIYNLLKESRKSFNDYNIVTVFGCGGDRDKSKRPKMLSAALEFSDKVIVTTDNPRTEDPVDIINDIILGEKSNSKVEIEIFREEAIRKAIVDYKEKTLVLIAGKGHEEYQDIKGVKHHFSDMEEIKKNIEKIKNEN